MNKQVIKDLIEKSFEVSETISEFKKFVLDIIDSIDYKTININIETLQKNYSVKKSKNQAREAIEKMIETLDSFSKDQTSE